MYIQLKKLMQFTVELSNPAELGYRAFLAWFGLSSAFYQHKIAVPNTERNKMRWMVFL